ncbi:hypothetical protein P280DRAFT_84931 [Massarina eburnea CBS 473.64]|uniref:Uncharacterized protein n=1 Tax=Massarina eburnea CBS 473.64 TaxID=1395130 RepID=A0A6A6RW64_9PLEO|nr:hypothetical protein P280DRAFT_84931 [Massarina eburnea CBS 473.64]
MNSLGIHLPSGAIVRGPILISIFSASFRPNENCFPTLPPPIISMPSTLCFLSLSFIIFPGYVGCLVHSQQAFQLMASNLLPPYRKTPHSHSCVMHDIVKPVLVTDKRKISTRDSELLGLVSQIVEYILLAWDFVREDGRML